MRVLIVGGNGNIGASVVARLLAAGHEVTCFNRGLTGLCHPDADVIIGDRSDRAAFERAIQARAFDAAIDLTSYTRADAESSIRAFRDVGHVIHCSTVATYGRRFDQVPTPEEHPLRPHNDYGRNKVEADEALLGAHAASGFPVTIVKPAIAYGPRFGLLRQLGQDLTWIARIRAGLPILVCGDGSARHQFMYVDDLAAVMVALLDNPLSKGQILNAVHPLPTSWRDYHHTAMAVLGQDVPLIGATPDQIFAASVAGGKRVSDIFSHDSFFSAERMLRLTNLSPQVSLADGIARTIEALDRDRRIPHLLSGWEDHLIEEIRGQVSVPRHIVEEEPEESPTTIVTEGATGRRRFIDDILTPRFDAPQESRIVKLVRQGIDGHAYNVVAYGDVLWALHWEEGPFDPDRALAGQARKPMLVGTSIEEISYGLQQLKKAAPEDQPLFEGLVDNLYLLNFEHLETVPEQLQSTPAFKNSRLKVENLFEPGNGDAIMIISPAPARTCNYRCEYCYHHDYGFHKNSQATERWSQAILTAVDRIPRPIRFSAGAMGEPLYIAKWRETAIQLLNRPNVLSLAFVSNLTCEVEPFVDQVDPNRLAVMVSLHPTQFKDHDQEWARLLARLAYLKGRGVSLVVNYVLTPDQVNRFHSYRSALIDLGIPMTSNVLRGPYRGKMYPKDFTDEELEIVKTCYDENSYIFDSQSHYRDPYGIECVSGRLGFYLEFDGGLFNCHFARQRLGSIFDDTLMIRSENCFCTARKCESQTTIGWQSDVYQTFEAQRTLHHYIRRPVATSTFPPSS